MLKSFQDLEKDWESFEQNDLRKGTFPEGSVWRPVGKVVIVMMIVILSDGDDGEVVDCPTQLSCTWIFICCCVP